MPLKYFCLAIGAMASAIDASRFVIPDWLSLGGFFASLSFVALVEPSSLGPRLMCAAFSALAPLLARWMSRLSLGLGDVKFSLVIGFCFMGQALWVILSACLCGLCFLLLSGLARSRFRLAFAPFLSMAMALTMLGQGLLELLPIKPFVYAQAMSGPLGGL